MKDNRKKCSIMTLNKFVTFKNGKAHEGIVTKNGQFILVNSKFISSNGSVIKTTNEQKTPIFKDDIVMVMSDVPNGRALAKCFLINENHKYTLNQRVCALKIKGKNDPCYLFYILNRNSYYLKFDNGVGQTNLKKNEVLNCPISLPPLKEQKKVVEILSTWDQAIENLEKLISAKEKQFKWLLKNLISDQKSNWSIVELGKICDIKKGATITKKQTHYGSIPVVAGGKCPAYYHDVANRQSPVITVSASGAYAGFVNIFNIPIYASDCSTVSIRNKSININFIYNILKHKQDDIYKLQKGGGLPHVYPKDLEKIKIPLPSSQEQKKICRYFSTTDQEIKILKQLSKKHEEQKKGLMQQLLTGKKKVRL